MSSDFSVRLQQILQAENLTSYGAAQIIGAETDESLETIQQRWARWQKQTPKTMQAIEQDLAILGYRIKIEKIGRQAD